MMVSFELFLIFFIITTVLVILISIFYKFQFNESFSYKLKLTIILLIIMSVVFYIINSLPNLYNKSDAILTSETVVPSNLLFIILCISVYFFLNKVSFKNKEKFENDIERSDEIIELKQKNYDFEPDYEDLSYYYSMDTGLTKNKELYENTEIATIEDKNFKELTDFIDELCENN